MELLVGLDAIKFIIPTGLMYLSMNDMAAIKSIINTLQIPSLENRVRLLKSVLVYY
jgi:hypothetical protein